MTLFGAALPRARAVEAYRNDACTETPLPPVAPASIRWWRSFPQVIRIAEMQPPCPPNYAPF